jgi:hypothetical protein
MTWSKRDPVSNLIILGDDEGQVRKVAGLLASVRQDQQYPARQNYELVQKDGESHWLAGSASLSRQLFPGDVGKFVKCVFTGWGKSANGKFKQIEVQVFDGEPTDEMKKWPRYTQVSKKAAADGGTPPVGDPPEEVPVDEEEDDDLPF